MDLTVCICTHDRPRYVAECLDGLRRQTIARERFDILLVDSASTGAAPAELVRLAATHAARLIRVARPGVSAARNAGAQASAQAAGGRYIAYIDDDAIPAPDWVECILAVLSEHRACAVAVIGGRILPKWEAPLPAWWPASLRGVLSIIEYEGRGAYRSAELPDGLEPYAANMVVHVPSLLEVGGFGSGAGRYGNSLLSDEEVQLAWMLQDRGGRAIYDSRIVVHHQIQARRLCPEWLLSRLYWQGASTVLTRRLLNRRGSVWRELPRRIEVLLICAPAALIPRRATWLLGARWRLAYAGGFIRAACGWNAARTAAKRAHGEASGATSGATGGAT